MSYAGKLLFVELSERKVEEQEIDLEIASKFIGGRGYAAFLLFKMLKPKTEPLSNENPLIFMTGPLTGIAPASGRSCMTSKSPLTNTIFDSQIGGYFGVELKKAGYDGMVITGASKVPVYLSIKNGNVEIKDASTLWGLNVSETISKIKSKEKNSRVLAIGRAGENLVKYACIIDDEGRALGRGGLGAVMGYKKLKAIAVRGKNKITPVNTYAFKKYSKEFSELLKNHPITGDILGRFGTLLLMNPVNKHGVLPVRNFTRGGLDEVGHLSGETLNKFLKERRGCALCPIKCGRIMKIGETQTLNLEYETAWALGINCCISDPETVAKANNLCNELGMDTISMGNCIAFLMECSEKGLVRDKIAFGDKEKVLELIQKTAHRRGIGNLLAEGVKMMSQRIDGSEEFAIHVKGLELPAYDPRGLTGQALAYVTSNRGGCHLRAYLVPQEILSIPEYVDNLRIEGKAKMVKEIEDIFAVLDSLLICKFTSLAVFSTLNFEVDIYAKLLTTATGFYFDEDELKKAGERIYNIERLFNVREGFDYRHDRLPPRFAKPLIGGAAEGHVERIGELLPEYYKLRGWNSQGIPEERKLKKLGLEYYKQYPKLQVALDFRDLEDAIECAKACVKGGAHWLEVGTPLIKSEGMHAVRKLRELFPEKTIVADLKTMDTGFLEVEMAAQAGADIVGIAGAANNATISDAVGAGRKYDVEIMADLINIGDVEKRAKELEKLGVDYIEFHISIDEQLRSGNEKVPFPLVKKVVDSVNIPVAVAGGLRADTAPLALKSGAKIIVVGGAITRAADPEKATRLILKSIGVV
ncbi:MAG: aldehyde ferredoxin oxidoreductase [Thermoplasmata archaeon]|nr:MAG: aldehyde ferredoxin oxidoreductase [Thermoplasmata archaeon]